jgi:putative Ca2+/H+ antiporter (TMEM165/GDT1 family)
VFAAVGGLCHPSPPPAVEGTTVLYAFAVATILITLAELGDKTQLLALALACKYKAWQVLVGIFVATLAIHLVSTLAGELIGRLIHPFWLSIGSGILFVGFGIWTLRGDSGPNEAELSPAARFGPIVTSGIAFFIAEIGDKTQIMTMTIAADPASVLRTFGSAGPAIDRALASIGLSAAALTPQAAFWGVWMGSTIGMMIADGIAIVVGVVMGKSLPEKLITRISGTIFILFGVGAVVAAFAGKG